MSLIINKFSSSLLYLIRTKIYLRIFHKKKVFYEHFVLPVENHTAHHELQTHTLLLWLLALLRDWVRHFSMFHWVMTYDKVRWYLSVSIYIFVIYQEREFFHLISILILFTQHNPILILSLTLGKEAAE